VALRRLARFWIGVALVLSAARASADDPAPRAVVDGPVHDFGSVEQGVAVEHVFRVRNTGTAPMRVDQVKGTCACTVGVATGEPIAAGGEAWVTMRLDTARLSGRTTKTATVYTNDPVTPTVSVTLTGQVLADVVVYPAPLYFGHVRRGTAARREITVASGRPMGTVGVVSVELTSSRLRAWLEPAADGSGQRVVVEIAATADVGRFSDEVVLHTTSERQPTITAKVLGSIE
jgi:hypothetical protein